MACFTECVRSGSATSSSRRLIIFVMRKKVSASVDAMGSSMTSRVGGRGALVVDLSSS